MNKDLDNWLHCLKSCNRWFALHFIKKLLRKRAIDAKGAYWLINKICPHYE